MMTMTNSVYASLKRKGLHNWGFLNLKDTDFDFNDIDIEALELEDTDWFLFEQDE